MLALFYGRGSPYVELAAYLRWFAAGYALAYGATVYTAILNGMEQAHKTFVAAAIAAAALTR